jgi:hypothetical protein
MASELDIYLNDMLGNLDSMEDFEAEEHLDSLARLGAKTSNPALVRAVSQARTARAKVQAGSMIGGIKPRPAGVGGQLKAMTTITVKRDSANIAGKALPFVLFGLGESRAGYVDAIAQILPSGVTFNSVKFGRDNTNNTYAKKAVFSFTEGLNTDTITVECQTVPYPSLLEATESDSFRLSNIRYGLSDSTAVSQFDYEIGLRSRSLFGKVSGDSLIPAAFKSPEQYQAGIIDLSGVTWDVDNETAITGLIKDTASFTVSFNLFIERVSKVGRGGL